MISLPFHGSLPATLGQLFTDFMSSSSSVTSVMGHVSVHLRVDPSVHVFPEEEMLKVKSECDGIIDRLCFEAFHCLV